jgi:hypothetical protein
MRSVLDATGAKGDMWVDTVFDMMSGKQIVVKTTCKSTPGPKKKKWVFINRDNVIHREERWEIDEKGRTLLMEVAPIFTARRKGMAAAGRKTKTAGIAEIAEGFIVKASRGPKPDETCALKIGRDAQLHASVKKLYRKIGNAYAVVPMPRACEGRQGKSLPPDTRWLRSTATVQADADKIRALSARLKGTLTDPCKIAKEFNTYVFINIEKRNVATFSSALETLKAGFGDCGEHAVLLAALLRSAGVASRVVYGMVYIGPKGGFMYHAWVQARAQKWINADPALGVFPAWKGYVPLIIDDTGENAIFLANIIGRIDIDYMPASRVILKK